jgi:hypothetical protein
MSGRQGRQRPQKEGLLEAQQPFTAVLGDTATRLEASPQVSGSVGRIAPVCPERPGGI